MTWLVHVSLKRTLSDWLGAKVIPVYYLRLFVHRVWQLCSDSQNARHPVTTLHTRKHLTTALTNVTSLLSADQEAFGFLQRETKRRKHKGWTIDAPIGAWPPTKNWEVHSESLCLVRGVGFLSCDSFRDWTRLDKLRQSIKEPPTLIKWWKRKIKCVW